MRWRADEIAEWNRVEEIAARVGVAPGWIDAALSVAARRVRRAIARGVPAESASSDATVVSILRRLVAREPHITSDTGGPWGRPRKEEGESDG
jgi:hypothetical protein